MKRIVAVMALVCAAAGPTACERRADKTVETATVAASDSDSRAAAPGTAAAPTPPTPPTPAPAADAMTGAPAAPGAPAFAVLYPAATLDGPAVVANGPAGPGGLANYSTDAAPEAVIAFHRAQAEAAGLTSTTEMNQGEARAYGATSRDGGKNLQVVASTLEDGATSVLLTWTAGR